jgi:sulfate/thiosulfate transport system substrate-binding protein
MTKLLNTLAAATALSVALAGGPVLADTTLLNVSYDPTRELYKAVNEAFMAAPASRPAPSSMASRPMW